MTAVKPGDWVVRDDGLRPPIRVYQVVMGESSAIFGGHILAKPLGEDHKVPLVPKEYRIATPEEIASCVAERMTRNHTIYFTTTCAGCPRMIEITLDTIRPAYCRDCHRTGRANGSYGYL